jgi:uncharacterized protein YuzE
VKIKYFEDTDTALLEFGGTPVQTREVSENIYLDLDHEGRVVAITIEHASERGDFSEFSFIRINESSAPAEAAT